MTPSESFWLCSVFLEDFLHCFPMVGTQVDFPGSSIFYFEIGFCYTLCNPISLHRSLRRFPATDNTANFIL